MRGWRRGLSGLRVGDFRAAGIGFCSGFRGRAFGFGSFCVLAPGDRANMFGLSSGCNKPDELFGFWLRRPGRWRRIGIFTWGFGPSIRTIVRVSDLGSAPRPGRFHLECSSCGTFQHRTIVRLTEAQAR